MKTIGKIIGIVLVVALILAALGGIGMLVMSRVGAARLANGAGRIGIAGGFGFLAPVLLTCLLGVLAIGGIILLIIWLVPKTNAPAPSSDTSANMAIANTPAKSKLLDIIQVRYAKGEITKEQFDQMKLDLA